MFQTEHKFYIQYLFSENCVIYEIMSEKLWNQRGHRWRYETA